jgi:hypothetical protein
MRFLPFENIKFISPLSIEKVLEKLKEITEPYKVFRFDFVNSKSFEGKIFRNRFLISRIHEYKYRYLGFPVIDGKIEATPKGTIIKIRVRMQIIQIIFLLVFCGITTLAIFLLLITSISDISNIFLALVPIGMLLFAYFGAMKGYKTERDKTVSTFTRVFNIFQ